MESPQNHAKTPWHSNASSLPYLLLTVTMHVLNIQDLNNRWGTLWVKIYRLTIWQVVANRELCRKIGCWFEVHCCWSYTWIEQPRWIPGVLVQINEGPMVVLLIYIHSWLCLSNAMLWDISAISWVSMTTIWCYTNSRLKIFQQTHKIKFTPILPHCILSTWVLTQHVLLLCMKDP